MAARALTYQGVSQSNSTDYSVPRSTKPNRLETLTFNNSKYGATTCNRIARGNSFVAASIVDWTE